MHVSSSAKFWDGVNEKFYKKYADLDKTHHRWADLVIQAKPIVGPLGREWAIPIKYEQGRDFKIPWTILSNHPVQGTGADIMAIARVSAFNRIKKLGIVCKFISTVHDSIVVDCYTKDIQTIANVFYEVFDDLQKNILKLFNYEWQTPLACECKYGPDMKNQTKLGRT